MDKYLSFSNHYKAVFDNYIKLFLLGTSLVITILGFTVVPVVVGDSYEYVLMLEAFKNHFSSDIRVSDVQSFINVAQKYPEIGYSIEILQKFILAIQNGEPDALSVLYKSYSGQYFAYHFWFYSLVNLPARAFFELLNINGTKAFPLTNACLMIGTIIYTLLLSKQTIAARILFFIFYLLGCNFIYFHWSHPEFYTAAALFLASIMFLDERYRLAVLMSAFAALQNPSSVLFIPVIILKALVTKYSFNPQKWLNSKVILYLSQLCFIGSVSLIPYIFYYYHFGVFSLITHYGFVDKRLIGIERLYSALFDLNQGIIVGFPGIIMGGSAVVLLRIINFILSKKRFLFNWADFLVLVFLLLLLPTLAQINWNSGQEIFMRYGFWTSMPLLVWLAVNLIEFGKPYKFLLISVVMILQLIPHSLFLYRHEWNINAGSMQPYIAWVFKHLPGLYNPEPEIFAERVRGVELIQGESVLQPKYAPFVYGKQGEILKVLLAKNSSYDQVSKKICGDTGQAIYTQTGQKVDFSKVKFNQQGWGYLSQSIYCNFNWPITIDFSSSGNALSFLGQGWSSPELWGIWSDGTVAELFIPPKQGERNDILLTAVVSGFVNKNYPQQNVDIFINNKFIERWTLRYKDGINQRQIKISSKLVNPKLTTSITFKLQEPISPAQLDLSSDKRILGIGLQKLRLEAIR